MPEIVNGITVPVDGDPVHLPANLRTFAEDFGDVVDTRAAEVGAAAAEAIAVAPVDAQMASVAGNPASAFAGELSATIDHSVGRDQADADGTVDDVPAIQDLLDDGARAQAWLRSVTPSGSSSPNYTLKTTLDLAFVKSLLGEGYQTRLSLPANGGSFTNGVVVRANTTAAHGWVRAYPNTPASEIARLFIDATAASANAHYPTVFEIGGSHHLRELFLYGVDSFVKQIAQYSDIVRIERVFSQDKPDTSTYLIDLSSIGGGDGVELRQIGMSRASTATDRPKLLSLRFRSGFTIENVLNGDIYLRDCQMGSVRALHQEFGFVTFENTSGSLSESSFYMRNAGDMTGAPVVITQPGGTAHSQRGQSVSLRDLEFRYGHGLFGGSPTTTHKNIDIQSIGGVNRSVVQIERCFRRDQNLSGAADANLYGVTTGLSEFDAYSHIASHDSTYENGSWYIEDKLPALASSVGIDTANSGTTFAWRTWGAASGTYYYKVAAYLDTVRGLARVGSTEWSVVLTNGSNGPEIVVAPEFRKRVMLRVYRGTSTGSYDKYVDIPLMAGSRLHDSGLEICGYPWQSRTAGAVASPNPGIDQGLEIGPGEDTVTSTAYGRAVAWSSDYTTPPSAGSWRRGDEVRLLVPASDGMGILTGWRRATDCTVGSPTHVMGTDWVKIYASTLAALNAFGSYGDQLTNGQETVSRMLVNSAGGFAMSSGTVRLAYFTARKSETISKIRTLSGTTAAAATPTMCKVGLYTVAGNGDLTLVASSANTTSLWAATSTTYETALSSPYAVVSGTRYAVALICVTATTAPTVAVSNPGAMSASEMAQDPKLAATVAGQTDLPASVSSGTAGGSAARIYAALVP